MGPPCSCYYFTILLLLLLLFHHLVIVKREGDLGKTFGFSFSNGSHPWAWDATIHIFTRFRFCCMCFIVVFLRPHFGHMLKRLLVQKPCKFTLVHLPVLLNPLCLPVDNMLTCSLRPLLKVSNLNIVNIIIIATLDHQHHHHDHHGYHHP